MKCYTFVLEFGGGTYIAQHAGQDLNDATRAYAQAILSSPHLPGAVFEAAVLLELSDYGPTAIDGMHGVWCMSCLIGQQMALLNIIQTDPQCPVTHTAQAPAKA